MHYTIADQYLYYGGDSSYCIVLLAENNSWATPFNSVLIRKLINHTGLNNGKINTGYLSKGTGL